MIYIKIISIAFVISQFSYLITYRNRFKPFNFVIDKLGCLKCVSFWSALIITNNIYLSATCSLIGYLVDKYLIKTDIRL